MALPAEDTQTEDLRRYVALNCSLKSGNSRSSTDVLLDVVASQLEGVGFTGSRFRVVDHEVAYGVTHDEGDGDGWPAIRAEIEAADLLVFGTPIWLGHPASPAQVVLERLDAFIAETDDRNQQPFVDKVAIAAVVGNEDGAHLVGSQLFQGLNDVGFTLPPGAMTYWVGEAMHGTDLIDLDEVPAKAASTAATMATNAVHLVRTLAQRPYPEVG